MKKRQMNFELLRILCMYMIVIGHCLFHGRVTAKLGYGTVNYFLSYLIQAFSVVHVNCFVMVGSYFSITREFRLERLLRLWRQIAFYSVGIFAVYAVFAEASGADLVHALLPISSRTYWFASVYMALSLLMPFVGKLAAELSKKQYRYLLFLLAVFMSLNHMLFQTNAYGSYSGRELGWFLFLALLAGYIRLHTVQKPEYTWYALGGYAFFSLAVLASHYLLVELHAEDANYFLNYNSPLALGSTLCLFLAVRNFSWRDAPADRLIGRLAGAAFGVYLIHDNYLIRYLVWDTFRASKVAHTHWAVIYAAAVAILVYLLCTAVELLRQRLFLEAAKLYRRTAFYRKEEQLCRNVDSVFGDLGEK